MTERQELEGAEDLTGVLGVLSFEQPATSPIPVGDTGQLLISDPSQARTVLADPGRFPQPFTATHEAATTQPGDDRRPPPLGPDAVAHGTAAFIEELEQALDPYGQSPVPLLHALRRPFARAAVAALLPALDRDARDAVADATLTWMDSLAAISNAERIPRAWTPTSRRERHARRRLLALLPAHTERQDPLATAVTLVAGTQVPLAAGAWTVLLAAEPGHHEATALHRVWETLRLYPPTWLIPRITTADTTLDGHPLPAGTPLLVSPLTLGQVPTMAPGAEAGRRPLTEYDPGRWSVPNSRRPGGWLPFGTGPHTCPGRSLALAQLVALVELCDRRGVRRLHALGASTTLGLVPKPDVAQFGPAT